MARHDLPHQVATGAHAVVLLDQAGRHTTDRLAVPVNITLIPLPPRSPELNPVENVWRYSRGNWRSNHVFASQDRILATCCEAWANLTREPWTIISIGSRDWAHEF
jgi:transposase